MEINKFLNEFGDWINNSSDFQNSMDRKKINDRVFPKTTKISNKISLDIGVLSEVKKDFLKHGGTVIKEEDNCFLIEVNSGTFYLNKKYVY
jgi:hypothetical protein